MSKCPMVIDADALNIIGSHRGWIAQLPRRCVLTPHKKELFGLISTTRNSYEELERTRELAMRQQIYIVIKGAYSIVVTPEGNAYFNPTGNPGMATAGSGDVLTGIILAFLAMLSGIFVKSGRKLFSSRSGIEYVFAPAKTAALK